MSFFTVDILTPASVVVKGIPADSLIIPTCRGEINVLPEHTHVVSKLETGVLTVEGAGTKRHFSVTAGICKVLKNKVTILAYTSEKAEDIDKERAENAMALAKEKLSGKDPLTDWELIKFRRKLERAEARLRLAYLR